MIRLFYDEWTTMLGGPIEQIVMLLKLFYDDNGRNIRVADKLGFCTIHLGEDMCLKVELKRLGIEAWEIHLFQPGVIGVSQSGAIQSPLIQT